MCDRSSHTREESGGKWGLRSVLHGTDQNPMLTISEVMSLMSFRSILQFDIPAQLPSNTDVYYCFV